MHSSVSDSLHCNVTRVISDQYQFLSDDDGVVIDERRLEITLIFGAGAKCRP